MKDYYWLNADSRKFLAQDYLREGVTPEARIREIAEAAEEILHIDGFADKFESYMKRGWFSLSSPIWANFGAKRGLPISCNGSYIPDDTYGIIGKAAEVAAMTKNGAGTSAYFGSLRPRGSGISTGGKTGGPVHFAEYFQAQTTIISQSNVRRGYFAGYLPVEHDDILEWLQIREEGHPIQDIAIGVCISDKWMEELEAGDKEKRKIWAKIIKKRYESGFPYIFWSDTVNNAAPEPYISAGYVIWASNMCAEICNAASEDESFVCDLASMNYLWFEDWSDTDAVETLFYFLDAVMSEYIEKVKDIPFMQAAYNFAVRQRAIGLGGLGWHSFLQSKLIAFESMEAKMWNVKIHKLLDEKTLKASKELAVMFGEPELLTGTGLRNITRIAIAPTMSSSTILGQVSQSIEPFNSNYFTRDLAKGKLTFRNPYLKDVLKKHEKDTDEVWDSILLHGGSVQHLDFLTEHERNVFKTFGEISQMEIAIQAAQRQKYIDQSQSLNFEIHPDTDPKEVSNLMIWCWKNGIKTLYYQRSANAAQSLSRSIMSCSSCEA